MRRRRGAAVNGTPDEATKEVCKRHFSLARSLILGLVRRSMRSLAFLFSVRFRQLRVVWLWLLQRAFIAGSRRSRRFRDATSFTLAPRHRLGPLIHDCVPGLVTFYDLRRNKLGSISSPTDFRPFGAPVILIDDHGVNYTKSADWT
jgi:hypothetical protein